MQPARIVSEVYLQHLQIVLLSYCCSDGVVVMSSHQSLSDTMMSGGCCFGTRMLPQYWSCGGHTIMCKQGIEEQAEHTSWGTTVLTASVWDAYLHRPGFDCQEFQYFSHRGLGLDVEPRVPEFHDEPAGNDEQQLMDSILTNMLFCWRWECVVEVNGSVEFIEVLNNHSSTSTLCLKLRMDQNTPHKNLAGIK